jgi:uncharacterized coiled-coil DUF342 family protein
MMKLVKFSMIGAAAASTVSPVQKVIELLGELKSKVQKDLDAESKAMAEYTVLCDDEITNAGFRITTATKEIESADATISEESAKIASEESALADAGTETATKTGEKEKATAIRAEEHSNFVALEAELESDINMLSRAYSVLKRELSNPKTSLLQVKSNNDVMNAVAALGAIADAAWMDNSAAKKIDAFMQADDEDELSLAQQPQAASYAYESKSGGILTTIQGMQDKAEEQLQKLRKDEMTKKHIFQMLEQSLSDALVVLSKQIAAAKSNLGAAKEGKAEAEDDLASSSKSKKEDIKFKAMWENNCQVKASEWDARQKDASDEMAAISKAQEILSGSPAPTAGSIALLQTSTKVKSIAMDDSRIKAMNLLKKLGRQYNSFGLMQLANKAKSDPFVKVRSLIEDMIAKLEKQAQEEATEKAFCDEEISESKAKRDELQADLDKFNARLDKANATTQKLTDEVAALQSELASLAKTMAEATKLRAEEKGANTAAIADFSASVEAVQNAIVVLKEYYGGASFIQQPTFAGKNTDTASVILSMLEVAESDFSKLLSDTKLSEEEGESAFDKQKQEAAVAKATMSAEVKGKTSEIASLKNSASDLKSDITGKNTELDAVMDYLEKMNKRCTSVGMTYEQRKAKRDAEVAGLKEALDILAGDEPAVLLQKKAFLAARK